MLNEILKEHAKLWLASLLLYYLIAWPHHLGGDDPVYGRGAGVAIYAQLYVLGSLWPTLLASGFYAALCAPLTMFWESRPALDRVPLTFILAFLFGPLYSLVLSWVCPSYPSLCVPPPTKAGYEFMDVLSPL